MRRAMSLISPGWKQFMTSPHITTMGSATIAPGNPTRFRT